MVSARAAKERAAWRLVVGMDTARLAAFAIDRSIAYFFLSAGNKFSGDVYLEEDSRRSVTNPVHRAARQLPERQALFAARWLAIASILVL